MLQSIIKYEQDELQSCKSLLDQCHDDPDVLVNYAAISFKEGKYDKARQQYLDVMNMVGYSPDLAYNIALCYYREKNFIAALNYISEIVEKGVRNHPELSVGSRTGIFRDLSLSPYSLTHSLYVIDGLDVRSVGNSVVLKETCLIEAFNLKAAIEYSMKTSEPAKVDNDLSAAKEALTDMPPRLESELDPVTLHNQALCHADEDATGAFKKLSYLLANPPYPPEVRSTFVPSN